MWVCFVKDNKEIYKGYWPRVKWSFCKIYYQWIELSCNYEKLGIIVYLQDVVFKGKISSKPAFFSLSLKIFQVRKLWQWDLRSDSTYKDDSFQIRSEKRCRCNDIMILNGAHILSALSDLWISPIL